MGNPEFAARHPQDKGFGSDDRVHSIEFPMLGAGEFVWPSIASGECDNSP